MNTHISMNQVITTLEAKGLGYGILQLQNGAQAVISTYTGHVLGPYLAADDESLLWTNRAMGDPESLGRLVADSDWNIGGDRIWIAPEIQYFVRDRTRYRETLAIPKQMDPGSYALAKGDGDTWKLSQEVTMEAYNLSTGTKKLQVEREFRPTPDPLTNLSAYDELLDGVTYVGYEHSISLTDLNPNSIMSESWSLAQGNSGGWLWIPCAAEAEVTDYYAPIDADHLKRHSHFLQIAISGHMQYKIGLKAASIFDRMAYVNKLGDGRAYLIVRGFHNNPSAPYLEEPAHRPGCSGHAVHVYNDDGGLGGFGEMECGGQAVGGPTGRTSRTEQYLLWFNVGAPEKIDAIFLSLMGQR